MYAKIYVYICIGENVGGRLSYFIHKIFGTNVDMRGTFKYPESYGFFKKNCH